MISVWNISTKHDAWHLLSSLRTNYEYTIKWTGNTFWGLTMNWKYDKGYVDISMPKYIPHILGRFKHKKAEKLQYSPHQHVLIKFSSKTRQSAIEADQMVLHNEKSKNAKRFWLPPLLHTCNRRHDSPCPRYYWFKAGESHRKHKESLYLIIGLYLPLTRMTIFDSIPATFSWLPTMILHTLFS